MQRLIPHLKIWGPLYVPFALTIIGFFAIRTTFAIVSLEWMAILTFGGLFVFFGLFLRGMIIGLIDPLVVPNRKMNVTIENNGLGVMLGETRWYLFLDGVTGVTEYVDGLWTIEHWNGSIVHIPKHLVSADQLNHIRERMSHGATADSVTETIKRGKLIQELTQSENRR